MIDWGGKGLLAKVKTYYTCSVCGYETSRWLGKCPDCNEWNTLVESTQVKKNIGTKELKRAPGIGSEALLMKDIPHENHLRTQTGFTELDRVLGGGIVEGALMLVGGDPGVGKSTLLLQVCGTLAQGNNRILYISGEESVKQIKMRAIRLGMGERELYLLAENAMDAIEEKIAAIKPDYIVVDSIQTVYRPDMSSAPGSVSQVRECASGLMRIAKTTGSSIFLVGHVTKEGALAGPRVLEHMVDVVLYFEGDKQQEYRLLRAVKNRFGSVNELGIFQMTGEGMQQVKNASEMFLSMRAKGASGSVVFCAMEGSRPLLADIQALATQSYYGIPRRTVNGMDQGRVALLLAVLEKRAGQRLYNQDVYINVAGGLSLSEPATDLAVCAAVASSLQNKILPQDTVVLGEVGLAGEVRAITQLERRLHESMRLGFTKGVVPRQSLKQMQIPEGMEVKGVDTLAQALALLL